MQGSATTFLEGACRATVVTAYLPRRDAGFHDGREGQAEHACHRRAGHGLRHSHVCRCGCRFYLLEESRARDTRRAMRDGESRPREPAEPLVVRVASRIRGGRGGRG